MAHETKLAAEGARPDPNHDLVLAILKAEAPCYEHALATALGRAMAA